jgi:hypothetical protein
MSVEQPQVGLEGHSQAGCVSVFIFIFPVLVLITGQSGCTAACQWSHASSSGTEPSCCVTHAEADNNIHLLLGY